MFETYIIQYAAAFRTVIEALLGCEAVVTDFQSDGGRTVLYADLISALPLDVFNSSYLALYCPVGGASLSTGAPACLAFTQAFQEAGIPVAGVYYQRNNATGTVTTQQAGAANASKLGTYQAIDTGEVVCVDISFEDFAFYYDQYAVAFQLGIELALNLTRGSAVVSDTRPSLADTTCVYYDSILPFTLTGASDYSVVQDAYNLVRLFTSCTSYGAEHAACCSDPGACANTNIVACVFGCPARVSAPPPLKPLVASLQLFGLPVQNAYYNQEFSQPPPPFPPTFKPFEP